jgi:hypothetical protein
MKAFLPAFLRSRGYTFSFVTIALVAVALLLGLRLRAEGQSGSYTSARPNKSDAYRRYDWQHGDYPPGTIKGEAVDEAKGGVTFRGTPVAPRTIKCFPAEPRDLFWQMDMVFSKKAGKLVPLDFDEDEDGEVGDKPNPEFNGRDPLGDPADRDGIRGRNTWLLWGGGNEAFWGWLQEQAYGLNDFLILMDSRQRANRFKTAGLINQPGFVSSNERILGLYLDKADGEKALLRPPPKRLPSGDVDEEWVKSRPRYSDRYKAEPEEYDAQGRKLKNPVYRPAPPQNHYTELFEPWMTKQEWKEQKRSDDDPFKNYVPEVVRERLPYDGLDPQVYGYPSGIFGLRLMLNPDFFAKTDGAAEARKYWKKQVEETNGRYYTEAGIHSDPKLIRPFRVTMSCGFCHVAQHPLNPPVRDDEPKWENLSSIIGAQYWDPQPAFGNLLKRPNFLHHFLKSQAPGSVDTSLVSTDHINNTNVINPIFDVPARLARAGTKPTELQSAENLLLPSIEDPDTSHMPYAKDTYRHFPMVLGPGEDSVGVFGALARVPLNIGFFSEQWMRTGNLILGYTPQRPFRIAVNRANSVFWNVNEKFRVPYMAHFFDLGHKGKVAKSTAAMKLKDAQDVVRGPDGNATLDASGKVVMEPIGQKLLDQVPPGKELPWKTPQALRDAGRDVFLNNCAICHSSKLPKNFDLRFSRETPVGGWSNAPAPAADANPLIYTLPMEYRRWDDFRKSPAMDDFRKRIHQVAGESPKPGEDDPFIKDNFLSNELRIPITLVGTYAGRALATNAMAGQVWDNYSSETFKRLESVGKIRYFNPYSGESSDEFGTNDEFDDGRTRGGPGYFRPATLISIWATAPFFHNNALGIYTHDTSVNGRMLGFDDAIRKLLWKEQRPAYERNGRTYVPPGDLRAEGSTASANDPGYIYRLPVDTYATFQPGFTPLLIQGLLIGYLGIGPGMFLFSVLSFWIWLLLAVVFIILIFCGRARHAGILLLLLALALAALLIVTGGGGGHGMMAGVLMMAATDLMGYTSLWLWLLVAAIGAGGVLLLLTRSELRWLTKFVFITATLIVLVVGILANKFLTGELKKVPLPLAILPNSWLNAEYKGIHVGPIPRGTPVNLLMNLDPTKRDKVAPALVALLKASVEIRNRRLIGEEAYSVIAKQAGPALMAASKCPDFVLDHGHYFGEVLDPDPAKNDEAKEALIAFLKTL